MKLILENWKKFLDEASNTGYNDKIDMDDEGNVILYHLSPSSEMIELDPAIAAEKRQNYSTQEFMTWDRPRVFFFTRKGQTDPGIGDIPGKPYSAKIPLSKLYPVHKDPAGYSSKKSKQEWFLETNPTPPGGGRSFREYFEEAERCEGSYNEYHPCSKHEKEFGETDWLTIRHHLRAPECSSITQNSPHLATLMSKWPAWPHNRVTRASFIHTLTIQMILLSRFGKKFQFRRWTNPFTSNL